jgi:hypothetical protein
MKTRNAPAPRRETAGQANGPFLVILFVVGPVLVHFAARMIAEAVPLYV